MRIWICLKAVSLESSVHAYSGNCQAKPVLAEFLQQEACLSTSIRRLHIWDTNASVSNAKTCHGMPSRVQTRITHSFQHGKKASICPQTKVYGLQAKSAGKRGSPVCLATYPTVNRGLMLFTERMDCTRFKNNVSSVPEPSQRFDVCGYEELQVLYTKNTKTGKLQSQNALAAMPSDMLESCEKASFSIRSNNLSSPQPTGRKTLCQQANQARHLVT